MSVGFIGKMKDVVVRTDLGKEKDIQHFTVPRRASMTKKKHFVSLSGQRRINTLGYNALTPNNDSWILLLFLYALKEEMKHQRRRMISDGFHHIHFQHNNARPHVANITTTKLYLLCTRAELDHFTASSIPTRHRSEWLLSLLGNEIKLCDQNFENEKKTLALECIKFQLSILHDMVNWQFE